MPKGKGLASRYKFNQEEFKVVPKGKGLAEKKSLVKKYRFKHEKMQSIFWTKWPIGALVVACSF